MRIISSVLFFYMGLIGVFSFAQTRSGYLPSSSSSARFFPCEGNLFYEQGFESGIPAGWQTIDADDHTPSPFISYMSKGWQWKPDFKDSSNHILCSASWYNPQGKADDWLISEPITVGSNTCLSWNAYSQDVFYQESYVVYISTTTADTSAFLAGDTLLYVAAEGYDINYRSVNLSAYAGQQVYIAFRHTSYDKFILCLDEIRFTEAKHRDIGVTWVAPFVADTNKISRFYLAIRNYGTDTLVLDSALQMHFSVDGGAVESYMVPDSLVLIPNDTLILKHDSTWKAPLTNRAYELCFWTSLPNDEDNTNDTLCLWKGIGTATAIENPLENAAVLYPNPVDDILYWSIDENIQVVDIKLFNSSGQLCGQWGEEAASTRRLSLQHLPEGMYFIRLQTQRGAIIAKKILKMP